MPRKRHKPEEIVTKLRQVDILVSQGQGIVDAIRQIGVSEVACVTSCSTAKSSTRCGRLRPSSKAGDATTIRSAGHAGVTASPQLTFHLDHSM
jgi:hypothetical protein